MRATGCTQCAYHTAPGVPVLVHQLCLWAHSLSAHTLTNSVSREAHRVHFVCDQACLLCSPLLCMSRNTQCIATRDTPCVTCRVIVRLKTNLWLPEMGSFLIQIYSQTYSMFRYNFCFLPLERVHLDSVYVFSRMHTLDACQMRKPQTGISQSDSKCK